MERLDLKVKSSQAKFMGIIISIVGAFTVTLYKGPAILFSASSPSKILHDFLMLPQLIWIIGGFLLTVANFFKSLLSIAQTWIIKQYPAELVVTLIFVIFATLISAIVSAIAERNPNAWKLRPGLELVAIGYSAILGSLRNIFHLLALRNNGPMFVTMFKPLRIVIAVIMGIIFLGDTLHLGSVIGAVIVTLGFYSVMWGKFKEKKIVKDSEICGFDSSSNKVPLLQHRKNGNIESLSEAKTESCVERVNFEY